MPHFDVFLSHNSVDKPWAIKLKEALEARGLSVWLDQDEIRPGDLFVDALEAGLEQSKSVALIVSPESMNSGWVREEYSRALSLAQRKRQTLQLIPIILREADIPGFLANRTWVDFRSDSAFDANVDRLVWGITGVRLNDASKRAKKSRSHDPRIATETVLHNLSQPDYGSFVGREVEIAKINRILRPYPHSQHALVTIDGVGGIGKTALALEIAHRQLLRMTSGTAKEHFQAIVWVSAKQTILTADGVRHRRRAFQTIEDLCLTIGSVLRVEESLRRQPEQKIDTIRRALAERRTLLIVDNLETVDDIEVIEFIRDLPAPTKAIVTTRHRLDVAYPIRLVGMDWEEALRLISQECTKKLVELTSNEARRLYDRTGGVPLAMVWSVAQIGTGHTVEGVLNRLGDPHSDIAHFCFDHAVKSIRGTPSYSLLMALACIDAASRDALGYVTELPELDRDDGLVQLEKLSLTNHDGSTFSMLPLTRVYAKAELDNNIGLKTRIERRYHQWIRGAPLRKGPREFHGVIAIDFGTTYSRVAVWDTLKNESVVVPSLTGSPLVPSIIGLALDGRVIVGEAADDNSFGDPAKKILDVKRLLQKQSTDVGDRTRVLLGSRQYLPQELVALIFAELKQQAERYIGESVRDAVVTVPAYFTEPQRAAIRDAGQMAGLIIRQLVNEPTAAALSFGADQVVEGRHLYLVYDLGGGSFDVSVIAVENYQIEVISTRGSFNVSGRAFDSRLVDYVVNSIRTAYGIDVSEDAEIRSRILREAEIGKRRLSATSSVVIDVPLISVGRHARVEVTRKLFESLIADLVGQTLDCVDGAIDDAVATAGVRREDIEQVLLVGGSTRIALVRSELASRLALDKRSVRTDVNPDDAVARGACFVARMYAPKEGNNDPVAVGNGRADRAPFPGPPLLSLREIATRTLGILVGDGLFEPIIARGSHIPARVTVRGFTNATDWATDIQILVFEGDDPIAFNNAFVGRLSISLPIPKPAGYHNIDITFSLDTSGLLNVEVLSVRDGQMWIGEIQSSMHLSPHELEEAKDLVQSALGSVPVRRPQE